MSAVTRRVARGRWMRGAIGIVLVVAAMATPPVAISQSQGGSYTMRKQVVAGGGGESAGGQYRIVGTIAQPAAGVQSGGTYKLTGGFHSPGASPGLVFCDGFEDTLCP